MTRIKRGYIKKKKHKRVLKLVAGFQLDGSRRYKTAQRKLDKSRQYLYTFRRLKKRTIRSNWVQKINSQLAQFYISYSIFLNFLNKKLSINLNRKLLATFSINEPLSFYSLIHLKKIL